MTAYPHTTDARLGQAEREIRTMRGQVGAIQVEMREFTTVQGHHGRALEEIGSNVATLVKGAAGQRSYKEIMMSVVATATLMSMAAGALTAWQHTFTGPIKEDIETAEKAHRELIPRINKLEARDGIHDTRMATMNAELGRNTAVIIEWRRHMERPFWSDLRQSRLEHTLREGGS